jgi:16S rRNA (guanine527-N7)-methyltransferase
MCDRKLFLKGLDRIGIKLEGGAVEDILLYCRELTKWNKRINLVARNTPPVEILEKHFLDSLTLLPVIDQYGGTSATLLDVGTGAGFPGLVLAAANSELQVTLVESRQKRVSFLRHIIRKLQLVNVKVIADRLEHADNLGGENFTFITSRAVADAGRFLAMIEGVIGSETLVIVMQATDGVEHWISGSRTENWQLLGSQNILLPFTGAPRLLSVVRKHQTDT